MKKIIFIAPKSDFSQQVSGTLITQGHSVIEIDDRMNYALPPKLRSWRWLWRVSRRIPWLRRRSNHALQTRIVHTALRERPDLVLALKGANITLPTLHALRRMHVVTAVWFPDNAANEPYATWVKKIGCQWDHLFSFDSAIRKQVPVDSHARVHVLPFGVEPNTFLIRDITDEDRIKYACDICFIGAPYPDRVALLEKIKDHNVKIWGWLGWKKTPLKQFWHGSLNAQESAKAYRLAKICVNTNVLPRVRGVNLKTFEIAASGGFQLTDHLADLDTAFVVGKELDVFTSPEEFREKIDYWLAHDAERQAIANAARERTLKDHTLSQRMQALMHAVFPA